MNDTIKALRDLGRIDQIDAAILALARVAADELDAAIADPNESRYSVGVLIGRYHTVLDSLLELPDVNDDERDDLAALFAGTAGVRDDATG